jgi:CxxC motif-containing protein (DUF1111 family)
MDTETTRDVALDQWGRALLEELLFRAAEAVSAAGAAGSAVDVSLSFRLTPRMQDDCIEIRTECSAEPPLVTRLTRPF